MNNRKPRNKRGKLCRTQFVQVIEEKEFIIRKGEKVPNPDFPGQRRITHHITKPTLQDKLVN